MDVLCTRYPSVNFLKVSKLGLFSHRIFSVACAVKLVSYIYLLVYLLKVDIGQSSVLANAESVSIVPTFKIYKDGSRVKEIVCPSREMLEQSVRHYSI